ncbi:hypothetical protein VTJ04DRAFT_2328 [Mycothermus thermophilus]|uniref:uncharacterized protein n=1 Tax=Humicola insolens TaxID=85995 RepID=UPI003744291C
MPRIQKRRCYSNRNIKASHDGRHSTLGWTEANRAISVSLVTPGFVENSDSLRVLGAGPSCSLIPGPQDTGIGERPCQIEEARGWRCQALFCIVAKQRSSAPLVPPLCLLIHVRFCGSAGPRPAPRRDPPSAVFPSFLVSIQVDVATRLLNSDRVVADTRALPLQSDRAVMSDLEFHLEPAYGVSDLRS